MIQILKRTWNNYKKQSLFKKFLYFIPLIILVVFCFFFFWIGDKTYKKKYFTLIDDEKKHVEKKIKKNNIEIKKIQKLEKKLKVQQKDHETNINKKYKEAEQIHKDIYDALPAYDIDKLKRIHARLNRKSRSRKSK